MKRLPLLFFPLLLLLPSAADAAVLPAATVDGPSADIVAYGDVDMAHDGTGGVAYVKKDGGVDHVFVARVKGGAFGTPVRVDATETGAGSLPSIAAGAGGRL